MEQSVPLSANAFRRCVALCSALAHSFSLPAPVRPAVLSSISEASKRTQTLDFFFSSSPAPSRSIPTSTGQCLFDTEAKDQNGDQSPTIGTAQSTFLLAEIETTPANSCVDDLQPSSGHPLFPPRPWQPPPEHTTPPFTDGRLCPPLPATRVPQRTVSDGIPIAGNQRRVIPTKFLPFPDDAAFSRRAAAAPANPAESGDEN